MSAHSQTWTIYRGEDATIVLTGADDTDPTGWTLAFTLSAYPGQDPVTLSTTSVTVGGSGPYTLSVTLSRAQTSALTGDRYTADVWRTSDAGSNINLATGSIVVLTPVRLPATS